MRNYDMFIASHTRSDRTIHENDILIYKDFSVARNMEHVFIYVLNTNTHQTIRVNLNSITYKNNLKRIDTFAGYKQPKLV